MAMDRADFRLSVKQAKETKDDQTKIQIIFRLLQSPPKGLELNDVRRLINKFASLTSERSILSFCNNIRHSIEIIKPKMDPYMYRILSCSIVLSLIDSLNNSCPKDRNPDNSVVEIMLQNAVFFTKHLIKGDNLKLALRLFRILGSRLDSERAILLLRSGVSNVFKNAIAEGAIKKIGALQVYTIYLSVLRSGVDLNTENQLIEVLKEQIQFLSSFNTSDDSILNQRSCLMKKLIKLIGSEARVWFAEEFPQLVSLD